VVNKVVAGDLVPPVQASALGHRMECVAGDNGLRAFLGNPSHAAEEDRYSFPVWVSAMLTENGNEHGLAGYDDLEVLQHFQIRLHLEGHAVLPGKILLPGELALSNSFRLVGLPQMLDG